MPEMGTENTAAQAREPRLMGLVLAGGRSSRMGRHKAALRLADGRTFLERACGLMTCLCPLAAVSWHSEERCSLPEGCLALYDTTPEIGPLGGLCTGLEEAARHGLAGLVTLPCDAPLVTEELLARLVSAWRTRKEEILVTALAASDGKPQPLMAVWDVRALPLLQKAVEAGLYSLRRIVPAEAWRLVRVAPEEDALLVNVNTPEDLESLVG